MVATWGPEKQQKLIEGRKKVEIANKEYQVTHAACFGQLAEWNDDFQNPTSVSSAEGSDAGKTSVPIAGDVKMEDGVTDGTDAGSINSRTAVLKFTGMLMTPV